MNTAQQQQEEHIMKTTITREMATHFVNIYHAEVSIHRADANYKTENYTDHFYGGCMRDNALKEMIEVGGEDTVFPFVQTIYDAIHILMCTTYTLAHNINYCIDYVNIDTQSITHLNTANKNYHLLHNIKNEHYLYAHKQEDLSDATYEPNTCGICDYENISKPAIKTFLKKFYYSTAFGLNVPVCSACVLASNTDKDTDDKDEEYQPTLFVKNKEREQKPPMEDDEDESIDAVDAYAVDPYAHTAANGENIVLTMAADLAPAYEYKYVSPADDYKAGWQAGWKGAMKYVQEQVSLNTDAPALPPCNNCGIETKTKKCGGSCNGCVRYCSVACQFADWKRVHKYACLKTTF